MTGAHDPLARYPVLIAGGGPVGLTLALELASRGVRALLVEKSPETTRFPKMDITNARTMELFRRLGVAEDLRRVAVPAANPFDVAWVTTLAGWELHRFRYPGVDGWRAASRACNDGTRAAEAPMRVSQVEIEPVLKARVLAAPGITARFGEAFESFEQDAGGVTAVVRDVATGVAETVRADRLVGCDGAASRVREGLGVALEGNPRFGLRFMVHFRSRALDLMQRRGITWHLQSARGTVIAQDDRETWTLQAGIPGDHDATPVDPAPLLRSVAGTDFDHEVLFTSAWTSRLVLADRYGAGRVFLAGDAAHQYNPTGGYGMNTGVGDAIDIGWKLAAVANGYAPPALLASYDAERRPVGARNLAASRAHTAVRAKIAGLYRQHEPAIHAASDRGDTARATLGAAIAELGNAENESWGIEWGYVYAESPVICRDSAGFVQDDPRRYLPTTTPGTRLPSVYLPDGSLLFDHLGRWFTLLATGGGDAGPFVAAAARRGLPLEVVRLDDPALARLYERKLVLVRPDQHVAWRGDRIDSVDAAGAVLARVLGDAES